ncbi:hypothetical protein LDENG_00254280 [Lucifuga dentata]|nr:hypothetical protein LDENG_00254280 [Lucifuga dentata]
MDGGGAPAGRAGQQQTAAERHRKSLQGAETHGSKKEQGPERRAALSSDYTEQYRGDSVCQQHRDTKEIAFSSHAFLETGEHDCQQTGRFVFGGKLSLRTPPALLTSR